MKSARGNGFSRKWIAPRPATCSRWAAEMDRGQDNGAGIGMTRAQIVDELLRQVVGRVDIEDEEGRLLVDHQLLRLA